MDEISMDMTKYDIVGSSGVSIQGITTNLTLSNDDSNQIKTLSVKDAFISIGLFILAGIFEVGGGYLVWIAIREKKRPPLFLIIGFITLMIYGLIPTLQPVDSFGRIFAVYGGFFIILSYSWAVYFDGMKLDTGDYIGSAIALSGVAIAWFWPR